MSIFLYGPANKINLFTDRYAAEAKASQPQGPIVSTRAGQRDAAVSFSLQKLFTKVMWLYWRLTYTPEPSEYTTNI